MKKEFFQIVVVLLMVMALVPVTQVSAKPVVFSITIVVGQSSDKCEGFGICSIKIEINTEEARRPGPREVAASAELEGNRMVVKFRGPVPARGKETVMPVDRDIAFSPEVAKALGLKSVVVLKGQYPIDVKAGKFGGVTLNVRAEKEAKGTNR
jgi:hypothetical protein